MKSLIEILRYTHGLSKLAAGIVVASILVALTGIAVPFVIAEVTNLMVAIVGGQTVETSAVALGRFVVWI